LEPGTSLCIDHHPFGIPIEDKVVPVKVDVAEQTAVATQPDQVSKVEESVEVLELPKQVEKVSIEDLPGVTEVYAPSFLPAEDNKKKKKKHQKNQNPEVEEKGMEETEHSKVQNAINELRKDYLLEGTSLCIKAELTTPTDDEDDEDEASSEVEEPIEASYFNAFKVKVDGPGLSYEFRFDGNQVHDIIAQTPPGDYPQGLFDAGDEQLTGYVGYGVVLKNLRTEEFKEVSLHADYTGPNADYSGCTKDKKDPSKDCDNQAEDWQDDDWVLLDKVCSHFKTSTVSEPAQWSCVDARP